MTDQIKTIYRIPEQNIKKLEHKLEILNRKAVKLGCDEIVLTRLSHEDVVILDDFGKDTGKVQRYLEIELVGEAPMLGGWAFVATIQHEAAGNIIRAVPGEEVPASFRTLDAKCEHCKTIRNRKDTYIVASDDPPLYKQVGRSCLRDFTGINSPQHAANYAELLIEMDEMFSDDDYFDTGGYAQEYRFSLERVLSWTVAVIRERGWTSGSKAWETGRASTATFVGSGLVEGKNWSKTSGIYIEEADEERAIKILLWGRDFLDRENLGDYEWNMKVAIGDDNISYRSLGLVCSLVSMYWRETEAARRKEEKRESNHIGEIKVRQEFTDLTLHKVIEIDGYYGTTYIHKFTDDAGNEIVWFASKGDLEEEKIFSGKATVKKHDKFNGVKQTVITRAKFEEQAE